MQRDDALRLRQGLGERAGDKNLDLQVELLDLVVEGDTMVVTHIDRLSRGLTHGLQVIEGLHRAGVEFRLSRAVTEWATGASESCTTDKNA